MLHSPSIVVYFPTPNIVYTYPGLLTLDSQEPRRSDSPHLHTSSTVLRTPSSFILLYFSIPATTYPSFNQPNPTTTALAPSSSGSHYLAVDLSQLTCKSFSSFFGPFVHVITAVSTGSVAGSLQPPESQKTITNCPTAVLLLLLLLLVKPQLVTGRWSLVTGRCQVAFRSSPIGLSIQYGTIWLRRPSNHPTPIRLLAQLRPHRGITCSASQLTDAISSPLASQESTSQLFTLD